MSRASVEFDIKLLNHVSFSTCRLSDLLLPNEKSGTQELNSNSSDFSSSFTSPTVVTLDARNLRAEGFWSNVFSGYVDGKGEVVVKLYKPQKIYNQRQIFDKFHQADADLLLCVS